MNPMPHPELPVADGAAPGLQLQVIDGPQRGARAPVPAGVAFTVGGHADCDIVLRGLASLPLAVRLCMQPQGLMSVEVLQGEVQVAGQPLAAGMRLQCAADAELQLGPVCIGLRSLPAVEGADAQLHPAAASDAGAAVPAGSAAPAAAPHAAARRWWQGLVLGGGALAAAAVGLLASALASAYVQPEAAIDPQAQGRQAQALLQASGLSQLQVRPDPDAEGLLVSGWLDTRAQRAQAERLLATQPLPARWQVHVNEQVAQAVAEVYRINGVQAQARPVGSGAVAVTTQEADASRLAHVREAARRDVPGLAAIEASNVPPPLPAAPPVVIDDPGKRVASIVPGEPPYVVTADGTRYFEGALLPTGHRIAGIERHRVLLDRDGAITPLVF